MLWFILCVAVLNMATGFGLAIFLAGASAGDAVRSSEHSDDDSSFEDFEVALSSEPDSSEPTETPPSAVALDEETEGVGNTTDVSSPSDASTASDASTPSDAKGSQESSGTSVMEDLDAAVSAALENASLPEGENGEEPSSQKERPEDHEEDALHAYHSQLESFCEELTALDDQLRNKPPEQTAELKSQLDSVTECSLKQDAAYQEAEQSLRKLISAETIDEKQGEAMIAAIQEERLGAAETVEAFEQIDVDADSAAQCEMVLDRAASLLDANHSLRDDVFDMISATETAEDDESTTAQVDALTEIMSRAAFDGILAEHWTKDPHRTRAVALTVIDLDQFAKFNRNHGPTVGNRVLRAMAQLLESESPSDCHIARFAGQRFAMLSIDRDLKQAVNDTERLRQSIETVQLEYRETNLEVTVSCGVVAAVQEDTQETLYARAIESVQEAKRYGRNRTFVHEGEYPTPVVPPNFTLNEKHVTV